MRRTTMAEWLVVGALAAFGLLWGASQASAQQSVRGTNVASGSVGASGPATGGNVGAAVAGPASAGLLGGVASSQMDGDTSTTVDQDTTAASGPAAAGSQVSRPAAGTRTQETNVSTGALAVSGPVTATSVANARSGPSSVAALGVASTSQSGDVTTTIAQEAIGVSGPAIAGSQIVSGGLGDALSQGTNVSFGALARTGGVGVHNLLTSTAGASAQALAGGTAVTGQVGDDDAFLTQSVAGSSGNAISGSQLTTDPIGTVQRTNSSAAAASTSGPVDAGNLLASAVGPSSLAFGPGSFSGTTHGGDASVVGSQVGGAASGHVVTGSQVYGPASLEAGVLDVPNQQASDPDFFAPPTSGDLPAALNPGLGGDLGALLGNLPDIGGFGSALDQMLQALQDYADQVSGALSGLLSGGFPGLLPGASPTPAPPAGAAAPAAIPAPTLDTGSIVQDTNVAAGNAGFSGAASATNAGVLQAGPSSSALSIGLVPAVAVTGQEGDAAATLGQNAFGLSGDTTVASQRVGSALGPPAGRIHGTNVAAGNIGGSGHVAASNAGAVRSGSHADAAAVSATLAGSATATAAQSGNTLSELAQTVGSQSGDAVSGAQVQDIASVAASPGLPGGAGAGVVSHHTNVALLGAALTGPAVSANVGAVNTGATAIALAATVGGQPGDAVSATDQVGDDRSLLTQDAAALTGDAATGSQLVRLLAVGGATRLSNFNLSALGLAATGPAVAVNHGTSDVGAYSRAAGVGARATAATHQVGNDSDLGTQLARSASGRAEAGSQDLRLVSSGLLVHNTNISTTAAAVSGAAVTKNFGSSAVGPGTDAFAIAATPAGVFTPGDATAVAGQWGDDDAVWTQRTGALSGGTLAGGQGDAVSGAGVLSDTNVGTLAFAHSGNALSTNLFASVTGPVAVALTVGAPAVAGGDANAFTTQIGSDRSVSTQLGDAITGDTISGSQLRTGLGGLGTALNAHSASSAHSGNSTVVNALGSVIGPIAGAVAVTAVDATAVSGQIGDDVLASSQHGAGISGDAAAGSQVDGGTFPTLLPGVNVTTGTSATTGPVTAPNVAVAFGGPPALSAGGTIVAGQVGSNLTSVFQNLLIRSGDVFSGTTFGVLSLLFGLFV